MTSLDETFRSIAKPQGSWAAWSPGKFVEAWESFVEEAISSYWGDLYEFENDLGVRDVLELALRSDQLDAFDAWTELSKRIRAAGERFRVLLCDGPEVRAGAPWWRERLPPHAGEDFVADAARLYGVKIALDWLES